VSNKKVSLEKSRLGFLKSLQDLTEAVRDVEHQEFCYGARKAVTEHVEIVNQATKTAIQKKKQELDDIKSLSAKSKENFIEAIQKKVEADSDQEDGEYIGDESERSSSSEDDSDMKDFVEDDEEGVEAAAEQEGGGEGKAAEQEGGGEGKAGDNKVPAFDNQVAEKEGGVEGKAGDNKVPAFDNKVAEKEGGGESKAAEKEGGGGIKADAGASQSKVVQGDKEEPQPAQGPTNPIDIKLWKEFLSFKEFCQTSGIRRS